MARGRDARAPTAIPPAGWIDIAARILSRVGGLRLVLLAAGIAFFGLLAIFPGLSAAVALIGLIYDPTLIVDQSPWLLSLLPDAAQRIIGNQLDQIASSDEDSLSFAAIVSLGIALWLASNAIGALMQGLNVIYEERERRGFLKSKLITILLTVGMIAVLGLTVAVVAAIPAAFAFLGAPESLTRAVLILRWPLMFAIGIAGLAVLYRLGPDRRSARWTWVTPGALVGCTLWVAGSYGFSAYVQSFGNYNETFGALAGVVILLIWLWLSAFVVLLGALLDAEIEAQTARDTTVGPARPMGERGAVKADRLGRTRAALQAEDAEPGADRGH